MKFFLDKLLRSEDALRWVGSDSQTRLHADLQVTSIKKILNRGNDGSKGTMLDLLKIRFSHRSFHRFVLCLHPLDQLNLRASPI